MIDLNNLNGFSLFFLFYYLFFSPNIVCCRRLTSVLRLRLRFRFRHLREKNSIIIDITQIYTYIYNRFVASYISEKKTNWKKLILFCCCCCCCVSILFSPANNNEIIAVEIEEIKIRQKKNRKRVEKESFLE